MNGLSIIVPSYNEEGSIAKTIELLQVVISNFHTPSEIIVVNDGSQDETSDILSSLQGRVKVITNERRLGYGAALKRGILNAGYDHVAIIDADGTYQPQDLGELLKASLEGKYDMVVGARKRVHIQEPVIRKLGKWFIMRLACYLSAQDIPDLNSGLRIMNLGVVKEFLHLLPDGFSFTTTITLAMLLNGYRVKFIPVNYSYKAGSSKVRPIRDTFGFAQLVIRTVMYFNPLKVFFPFSLLLVILAFLVLGLSSMIFGQPMDVTFGIMIMTAVLVLGIGMLADLIDKRMKIY